MSNINFKLLFRDRIKSGVVFDPLYNVSFIFSKFFRNIWAHVAKSFFDRLKRINDDILKSRKTHFRDFKRLFWWNSEFAVFDQILDEMRDVSSGNWDVFDARADDVAFSDGDDVRDAVARVDNGSSQAAFATFSRCPRRCKSQNS